MDIAWNAFTPVASLAGGLLIGAAASVLVLCNGRIAGISGIVAGLLPPSASDRAWRALFVLGLLLAPLLVSLASALPAPRIDAGYAAIVLAGLLVGVGTGAWLLIRPIAVPLLRRLGFRRVLFWASALCAAAIAGFALLQPDTPPWLIAGYAALYGFIRAIQFMGSNTLAYADTPPERLSRATSLGGVLQQLTVSLGVSAGATLLSLTTIEGEALTPARFHAVFLMLAIIPLLALPGKPDRHCPCRYPERFFRRALIFFSSSGPSGHSRLGSVGHFTVPRVARLSLVAGPMGHGFPHCWFRAREGV